MSSLLQPFTEFRTLLRDFVMRDLRSRYVGSSMGFFWSVIFPLINLCVFTFVFRIILKTRWGDEQGALEVSLVMLAGIVVWTAFAESISRSTNCLVDNANLIQKVKFPASVFPSYITLSAVLNMCIGLPIVLLAVVWFGYLSTPGAALERQHQYAQIWEGTGPVDDAGQAVSWPRVFVSLERAWQEPTTFRVEYGGTAERGVDYLAEHTEVVLPAGCARLYLPIIPLRDAIVEEAETIEVRLVEVEGRDVLVENGRAKDFVTITLNESTLSAEDVALDLGQRDPATLASYTSSSSGEHHPLALGPSLITLPFLLGLLVLYTVGLGAFFAAFNLYWRDTYHLIGVALTVWMFGTPIFYPADMVVRAGYGPMLQVNPMYWFIETFREVTLFGQWPDPRFVAQFAVAAVVMFWLGDRFFSRHEPKFPDLL